MSSAPVKTASALTVTANATAPQTRSIRVPDEILDALLTPWRTPWGARTADSLRSQAAAALEQSPPRADGLIEHNLAWRGRLRSTFALPFKDVDDWPGLPQTRAAVELLFTRIRIWRCIMRRSADFSLGATETLLRSGPTCDELTEAALQRLFAYTGSLLQVCATRGLDRRYRRALQALTETRISPRFVGECWRATGRPRRMLAALIEDLSDSQLTMRNIPDL